MKSILFIGFALLSGISMSQTAVPPAGATSFKDTSMLKPPAGEKLAIIEFEDLECYACGLASPIVRKAMVQYNIPRIHYDFLIHGHAWSRQAAINARYLQDRISPKVAEDFRRDVFSNQARISGPDDLQRFTQEWFRSHNVPTPFVMDASGQFAKEVDADCNLGSRLGVLHTPTIVVVTPKEWIEVTDPQQLYTAIDLAKSSLAVVVTSKKRK